MGARPQPKFIVRTGIQFK